MRRGAILCVLTTFLFVGCDRAGGPTATPDPQKAADLKWSRQVAEEFLNALLVAGSPMDACAPLTVAYKKRLAADKMDRLLRDDKLTPEERAAGWREIEVQEALERIQNQWPRTAWSIDSEEASPAADEATFKGVLKPPAGHWYVSGTFVLRVDKESEDGKWRVDGFTITPQQAKE